MLDNPISGTARCVFIYTAEEQRSGDFLLCSREEAEDYRRQVSALGEFFASDELYGHGLYRRYKAVRCAVATIQEEARHEGARAA